MKKGFLLLACFLVVLSSCGGDDTPANVVDPELVGVWRANNLRAFDCEDEEDNGEESNLICTSADCIQFTFDDESMFEGRSAVNDFVTVSVGTYSADNGTLRINSGEETLEGPYSITNNVLTYTYPSGGCSVEIIMDKN